MKKRKGLITALLFLLAVLVSVPVYAKPKLNKKETTMIVGEAITLKVTGTKKTVSWSSSNKKIVKVTKKGEVTALKAGKAVIKANVAGKTLKCKVTVLLPIVNPVSDKGKDEGYLTITFKQKAFIIAKLGITVKDRESGKTKVFCTGSCAMQETSTVLIDLSRYDIQSVSWYCWSWLFGWVKAKTLSWEKVSHATYYWLTENVKGLHITYTLHWYKNNSSSTSKEEDSIKVKSSS